MRLTAVALGLTLLAGCATSELPPRQPPTRPLPPNVPPDLTQPVPTPPSVEIQPLPPSTAPQAPAPSEREIRTLVARLLPSEAKDRAGWAGDLYTAFAHLGLPHAAPVYCAAIAVIEQESTFQADPVVPGLPAIVWRELEQRAGRYGVPMFVVTTALRKTSPNGKSYKERIDRVKTERELDALFTDMIAELPAGQQLFGGLNPVRTGGPMQVSIAFAERHAKERGYPYPAPKGIRPEVFTRRGGVYFGTAILLDYPAPYTEAVYRFADFNAGRYSSRNAAFQTALGRVAGKPMSLDGDLLRYRDGKPIPEPSGVELALRGLAPKLRLNAGEIRRDLLLEKEAAFGQSPLYQRVFTLADLAAGKPLPRQAMPRIDLKSPKITRKLTTEWFARRVDWRFRNCLARE